MITVKKSDERRHAAHGGQKSWKTFDGEPNGFRTLVCLNEEGLDPGAGFSFQPSSDVEILTYVLKGALIQEDPSGENRVVEAGECSRSSALSGSIHRTVNGSLSDDARAFQCCFLPDRASLKTQPDKKRFPMAERRGVLRLILSSDGRDASLRLRQDARMYSSILDPGHHLIHELVAGRAAWLQVVAGRVQLIGHSLVAGDGAALVDEPAVSLTAQEPSEILLIDLV